MSIGNKIMTLRKERNLSQEALAEKLEVSRQAVSKWEAEQCLPDIAKIIKLSSLFKVPTDYILKDDFKAEKNTGTINSSIEDILSEQIETEIIDSIKDSKIKILNKELINSTILIISGLVLFIGFYFAYKLIVPCMIAFLIQIIGICMFYNSQNKIKNTKDKEENKYNFYKRNIWLLTPIPLCISYFLLSPLYPRPINIYILFIIMLTIYLIICISVTMYLKKRIK